MKADMEFTSTEVPETQKKPNYTAEKTNYTMTGFRCSSFEPKTVKALENK